MQHHVIILLHVKIYYSVHFVSKEIERGILFLFPQDVQNVADARRETIR